MSQSIKHPAAHPAQTLLVLCLLASWNHPASAIEPEIRSDRSVVFRIDAPEAREVQLDIKGRTSDENGRQPVSMQQGADGIWSFHSSPLDPGFHYYFVFVDGYRCADSTNPLYFGWQRPTNGIDIPDPELTCYLPRKVPRGNLVIHPYFSELTGKWREAYVYTPPGYGRNRQESYPVLYLQHGAGENQTSWSNQGRASVIMDNLLAEEACRPMLVVMDYGYASPPGTERSNSSDLFERVLVEELIPEIERHFRARSQRSARAIAGLSRGGGQALRIGLRHLDKFSYVGCFSGAARGIAAASGGPGDLPPAATINEQLELLWMGCGTEDFVLERVEGLAQTMQEKGIEYELVTHPGTHEWQVWRRHLHLFAPRLFRDPNEE